MPQDLGNVLSGLQSMLSSDDGRKSIESLLGALAGGPVADRNAAAAERPEPVSVPDAGAGRTAADPEASPAAPSLFGNFNMQDIFSMVSRMNDISSNDPGVSLLNSLKPFLHAEKSAHLDDAVKILLIAKIPLLLMKGVANGGSNGRLNGGEADV